MDDLDGLTDRRNEPEVARYQDWAFPYPRRQAERMLTELVPMSGPQNDRWWMAIVELNRTGDTLGDVAVRLKQGAKVAEIGYSLSARHWGNGYASEAVEALVEQLFQSIGVGRIAASLDPANIGSARVLERTGFRYEGRTILSYWPGADRTGIVDDGSLEQPTDDLLYGMTRPDWDAWRSRPTEKAGRVRLVAVTFDNHRAVLDLETHKSQERFVSPVAESFCDALFPFSSEAGPHVPSMQAIEADGELVGFAMLGLQTEHNPEPYLWRLLIDRRHQRRGIGDRAVELVEQRFRDEGCASIVVCWVDGPGTPAPFYLARGYEPTGHLVDGEIEARLRLDR